MGRQAFWGIGFLGFGTVKRGALYQIRETCDKGISAASKWRSSPAGSASESFNPEPTATGRAGRPVAVSSGLNAIPFMFS